MNQNPYEAPQASDSFGYLPGGAKPPPSSRGPFVLAAIGAWLASVYWAALTLLVGLGAAIGNVSPTQLIMPCVLIGLYAFRGFQIFKGDANAAKAILWLHGIGAIMAVLQMFTGAGLVSMVLHGIKVAVNGFGGLTAYLAYRSTQNSF